MEKVKVIRVYGYNSSKGNMKGDVMCIDGAIYEMADFNPADFDVTGDEENQMKLCLDVIKKGEENNSWEEGHVTAQIEEIEYELQEEIS